jgi:hypothetical protein
VVHVGDLELLPAQAQRGGSTPVAAMPSLHSAGATLIAMFLATRMRSRWRYLLARYPVAMGFSLIYLGEQDVIDLVAGIVERYWAQQQRRWG